LDVFGQNTRLAGAFAANKASMKFSTGSGQSNLGLLIQNMQSGYTQQVSRLWELEQGDSTYLIVGRAQGQLSIARVVGPTPITSTFMKLFSDPCNASKNTIRINADSGACGGSTDKQQFDYCLISGISTGQSAADMLIQQQIQMLFVRQQAVN